MGTHSHFTDWLQVAKVTMHLAYLLFASFGLCMAESIIEEIPNYNQAMADRLAILEKKMLGLEEENKYLRTKSMKTCEDLRNSPYNETGVYTMDPDGSGKPVEVFCDMEKGVTEIGHDHINAENVTWCEGSGCFSLNITYDVPLEQIEALIAMSDVCEQEIKFECKLAPLKNAAFGVKFGWWTNQRDEKKYYFDGADEEREVCDINHNAGVCNCDMSLVPLWNSDTGRITNKNSLPIKGFYYGGFFSEHQAARVTIGKLRCSGRSKESTALVSTCSSLKKSGLSSNGFYLTKDSAEEDVSVNYCQLSSPGYKEEQLRREEGGFNLFSGNMEEFTIRDFTKSSARHYWRRDPSSGNSRYGASESQVQFYDMTKIQFEPTTSVNFDISDSLLTAKETGLFAFYSEHVELIVGNTWISQLDLNSNMASMALVKKGQNIGFKVTSTQDARNSTLTIIRLK